MFLVRKNYEKL